MFSNTKKFYFKALSLSFASMMSASSIANATCLKSTDDNQVPSFSCVKPENKENNKLVEWAKKHWIISGCIVTTAIEAGALAIGIPSLLGLETLGSKLLTNAVIDMQKKKFDTKPSKYTKRQEGLCWCWLACLQGMYKYNNIEISQEDIYKKMFKASPSYFEVFRRRGFPLSTTIIKPWVSAIDSIDPKLKYNQASIHIYNDKKTGSIAIKNAILDYYNSIGKSVFTILDSCNMKIPGKSKYLMHDINVVEINTDNNEITIEDPATGLSYKENLDEFCENYYDHGLLKMIPVIQMYSILPSELNLPVETHYFTNGTSYTKQSC